MAWVYVVQNAEGRFYIGMTSDLEQRLSDHNNGVSKWTKHRGPWRIVWSKECASISEARKLENKLKRQGRGNGFYRMIGLPPPSAPARLC
jgi:putative endonuclease